MFRNILNELRGMESNEETCDTWAYTSLAYTSVAQNIDEFDGLLIETEERLENLDGEGSMLAQAWIKMQSFVHEKRDLVVPKELVEKAFSYVLRYSDSTNTRSAFFDLIDASEEKGNKDRYTNPTIDAAILQGINHNPLYHADAMEQYLQSRGLERIDDGDLVQKLESSELYGLSANSLFDSFESGPAHASSPFVRQQPKLGRNDPCPCDSGRKFKKCCMGKGIYD